MIFYMSDPLELLESIKQPEHMDFRLPSGGILTTEVLSPNQVRIVNLISTDPMDYMDDDIQPGKVLYFRLSK